MVAKDDDEDWTRKTTNKHAENKKDSDKDGTAGSKK